MMLTADRLLSCFCFCFRSLPLRLYPDKHSHIFHPQAVIEFNGTLQNLDTSHIYIGHVEGMSKSEPVDFIGQDVSHGCIINNQKTPAGLGCSTVQTFWFCVECPPMALEIISASLAVIKVVWCITNCLTPKLIYKKILTSQKSSSWDGIKLQCCATANIVLRQTINKTD